MRFDDALEAALQVVRNHLEGRPSSITLVRDVAGQIVAVLDEDAIEATEWETLAAKLDERLGRFSAGVRRVLLRPSDLIDEHDVLASPDRVPLTDQKDVWLVDRLLTNQDWLREPLLERSPIPVATAFSLKGGVGRSTALAVLAWHLAREGKRVVAVDLDLEAPGLGSLLLPELPDYGLIDWLAESLVSSPDPGLLDDCLRFSPLADDATGLIQVVPAFGAKTRDYVAKVGRVYLPGLTPAGEEVGLAARLRGLLEELARRPEPPDAVLLDSRAGLHDIGAAAVTQLGAEAFLFARDEPQSWQAYRLLFEHLARSKGVRYGMPDEDLRWRMKMVAAQLDKTEGALANWVDASEGAWAALYDAEETERPKEIAAAEEEAGPQTFARDEVSAPHFPLAIHFDASLRGLDLADPARRPLWAVVEAAFGDFLQGAAARLAGDDEATGVSGQSD